MRILIADDHDLVRDALQSLLAADPDTQIDGVGDLNAAMQLLARGAAFDLILLDYAMPGMNGLEGLRRLLRLGDVPPVALLSGLASRDVAQQALAMGARGFLTKSMPARSLRNAIRFMLDGDQFAPVDLILPMTEGGAPKPEVMAAAPDTGTAVSLTSRELEVLSALCDGKTNKEIARELGLREPTIKLHVKTLYRRLGASNRTQAAMIARSAGLV